jgi:hypothetical protein
MAVEREQGNSSGNQEGECPSLEAGTRGLMRRYPE